MFPTVFLEVDLTLKGRNLANCSIVQQQIGLFLMNVVMSLLRENANVLGLFFCLLA